MTDDVLSDDDRRRIRLRELLDRWLVLVAVALVVTVALGGWLAYEPHVDPANVTDEEPVGEWGEIVSTSHQAEVRQPNPVFEEGTVLSQSLYYTRLTPELEGSYEYRYSSDHGGELDVDLETYLLVQAVDDDGNAYWSEREPLGQESVEGLEPGETAETSFAVVVADVDERIEEIEEGLGASVGTTEATVVVDATAAGEVGVEGGEEPVANNHAATFVLEPGGETYTVETDVEGTVEDGEFTREVTTERTYGPLRTYGSLALLVAGLAGLGALGYARHEDLIAPTEAELAALAEARQRAEFDEWISAGRFPEEEFAGPRIELDSLEDLVDVAIDCDGRVIGDADRDAFYVADGRMYYTYSPEIPSFGADVLGAADASLPEDGERLVGGELGDPTDDGTDADDGELASGDDDGAPASGDDGTPDDAGTPAAETDGLGFDEADLRDGESSAAGRDGSWTDGPSTEGPDEDRGGSSTDPAGGTEGPKTVIRWTPDASADGETGDDSDDWSPAADAAGSESPAEDSADESPAEDAAEGEHPTEDSADGSPAEESAGSESPDDPDGGSPADPEDR